MPMPLRRLIVLSSLVLGVAVLSPAPALGAANGTDRPLTGTSTSTSTFNLATGAGTTDGTSQLSHFGTTTFHNDFTFTITGDTITLTGTDTEVAANGDKLFSTFTITGTVSTGKSTGVFTVTGGTGRFAGASGTFTTTNTSTIVSTVGTIITTHDTNTVNGRISY
jgi:hypothetical protein